ncbi:hypothetical protein [Oryzifoliimicrobium ureilyticus]|uniref:hypothetical protein n=1 Tax=Oryzifoliimicrobium ureilyticus TaxID=3113724 RepID=UPI0030760DB7
MAASAPQKQDCSKLFRLLSAAREEAQKLKLASVGHLTHMAIIQLVLDLDGIDPEMIPDRMLENIVDNKMRMAQDAMRDNIVIYPGR